MNVTFLFRTPIPPTADVQDSTSSEAERESMDTPAVPSPFRPSTREDATAQTFRKPDGELSDGPDVAEPALNVEVGKLSVPTSARHLVRYVENKGRIILVGKARGGIGATTLAANLALEMQLQAKKQNGASGGRVALVDLDIQMGNIGSLLDMANRGGMLALAKLGTEPDVQAVRHAMVRHSSGLSVLAAPDAAIPFEAFDVQRVISMLDALVAAHDIVIVDLPPALVGWLEPLFERAERLLLVTDLAVPSIARARRSIARMTEDRPELPVEIVLARDKKPFRLGQVHRDAEAALGYPLLHWLPEEAKLARLASDRGEPLIALAPRCNWSKAVKVMAAKLRNPIKTDTPTIHLGHLRNV